MDPEPLIVECGLCRQPFAFPPDTLDPARAISALPQHPMLNPQGEPMAGSCNGFSLPAMVVGSRDVWEQRWRRDHRAARLPEVIGVRPLD